MDIEYVDIPDSEPVMIDTTLSVPEVKITNQPPFRPDISKLKIQRYDLREEACIMKYSIIEFYKNWTKYDLLFDFEVSSQQQPSGHKQPKSSNNHCYLEKSIHIMVGIATVYSWIDVDIVLMIGWFRRVLRYGGWYDRIHDGSMRCLVYVFD